MNRKLSKRVVRLLTIFSSTACLVGFSLHCSPTFGQETAPPVASQAYQWRVDASSVRQALATESAPTDRGNVVHASGSNLPPIVSPNQAEPSNNSLMLSPIQGANRTPDAQPPSNMMQPIQMETSTDAQRPSIHQPMIVQPGDMHATNNMLQPGILQPADMQNAHGLPQPMIVQPSDVQPTHGIPLPNSVPPMNEMNSVATQPMKTESSTMNPQDSLIDQGMVQQPVYVENSMMENQVEQAQWPAAEQNAPSVHVAQGNGTQIAPLQEQRQVQVFPMEPAPSVIGGGVRPALPPNATMPMQADVPPSSTLIDPSMQAPVPVPGDPGSANYFQANGQPPVYDPMSAGYCSNCGGAGCNTCGGVASAGVADAGCGCGPNGCFNQDDVDASFGCCGSVSAARSYFIMDGLYWRREDGDGFGGTTRGTLSGFDSEGGLRITLGRRWDATEGRELTYIGTDEMQRQAEYTSGTNSLNATFIPGAGFGVNELGSFFGASRQAEFQSTELHSIELNRTRWSWDVWKGFWGIRGIYVEDFYGLFSENTTQGSLTLDTRNNLIGPNVGGELFYDVGYRISFSTSIKGGVYLNLIDLDTVLNNNGAVIVSSEAEETDVSYSVDIDAIAHYQLTPQVRLRAAASILFLINMATANNNYPVLVNGQLGSSAGNSDDMRFLGLSGGIEIFR